MPESPAALIRPDTTPHAAPQTATSPPFCPTRSAGRSHRPLGAWISHPFQALRPTRVAGTLALLMALAGCATPTVVPVRTPSDSALTCTRLQDGFDAAVKAEAEARDTRGANGRNIAAVIFFWPALLGTFFNSEEAIDAAQARQRHLMTLAEQKGCIPPQTPPAAPAALPSRPAEGA